MSEITYNTDHGVFRLKSKNQEKAWNALHAWAIKYPGYEGEKLPSDLWPLLEYLGFGFTLDVNDDIVDVFLETSHLSDTRTCALFELAPFIEEGSQLVFYGGGYNDCFAITYRKNKAGKMEAREMSVECVLVEDLQAMLKVVRASKPELFRKLHKTYGKALKKGAK